MLYFDLARQGAAKPVEKLILRVELGSPLVAPDRHRHAQTVFAQFKSFEVEV